MGIKLLRGNGYTDDNDFSSFANETFGLSGTTSLTAGSYNYFDYFSLGNGESVTLTGDKTKFPTVIRISNDVTIAGEIDVDYYGADRRQRLSNADNQGAGCAGAGGGGGASNNATKLGNGGGGSGSTEFTLGSQGGVTAGGATGGGAGGISANANGSNGSSANDPLASGDFTNALTTPWNTEAYMSGAAGGYGGGDVGTPVESGYGGAGGGSMVLLVEGDLTFEATAEINARGEVGQNGGTDDDLGGGGGGGAGGAVAVLYTGSYTDNGVTMRVTGASGGSGASTAGDGGTGGDGSTLVEQI